MKNYINRMVVIFSVAMLVVSMCACGKSEVSDTTATTVEKVSTDADATKEDATKADSSSETQTTTELAKITTEKSTDSVTEEKDTVTEKSTTEGKKSESTTEKKTETTQQITTQNQSTTQAQATTQQSKPGNSGNNGNSQNNSQTATSHSHTWVNHTKIVHHDAQYEDQEVTKYKKEEHLFCNTCGADITNIGSDAHYAASGTMWINCGTDENPWWVEATRCSGCHGSWISVPYTETEKVKVKDAYDEEVTDYQYCSGCGQRK